MSAHRHRQSGPVPAGFDEFTVVCCHIALSERTIRFVARDEVGWTFACGGGDHDPDCWSAAHTFHFTDHDHSLAELGDLEAGGQAVRFAASAPWLRVPSST